MRYEKLAVSRPRPDVWMLTLNSPPDNRFTVRVLAELSAGLDQVEGEWRLANKGREPSKKSGGAIVIASALAKFFSNGYEPDIVHGPGFITDTAYPPLYRVLSFPLVTIAAIEGHAFAGGCLLAMCCDFRIMGTGKAWISMNEVFAGMPLSYAVAAIVSTRVDKRLYRDITLGKRWTAYEARDVGIIDEVVDNSVDSRAVIDRAVALGEEKAPLVASGAWDSIKISEHGESGKLPLNPEEQAKRFWGKMEKKKAYL
ncbi:uncharacterized protein EHS24_007359 [Apiotrichum porosum]|uniref:Uncharacterized protein n=1 Tax=Apiotrichum porosum TaxID=105984 RepID=A0A427XUH3_9TREE|nr:uncharacterized protein EHS24_007359 [Apiotrichum porosum]RSH82391.1 hypothetical protein EHS24_007359 [Apiotrichum porosum]